MPLDQRSHSVGRDRTLLQPEVDALFVDLHDGRLGAGIVMSEDFDERAVARRTRIGDYDAEERTLLGSCAAQTNGDHVTLLNDPRGSYPNVCFAARARLKTLSKNHVERKDRKARKASFSKRFFFAVLAARGES